jgi:OHCU decarboxylase
MAQLADEVARINHLDDARFTEKFSRLSTSKTWVREMARRRPFASPERLLHDAADVWWNVCTREDWIEAFNGRPLIGDQQSFEKDLWCAKEDALTIQAPRHIADELMACNAPYARKFGYVWILLCEGLTPEQQLTNYRRRIDNDPETELRENCVEELKVTLRRLRLCLHGEDPYDAPPAEPRAPVETSRPSAAPGTASVATQAPIGVGVIGAGVIGEALCEAFTRHGGYRIAAVADLSAERAQRLAGAFQARAMTDARELMEREDVSLVYIGVPPREHCALLERALEAGKHVLCEKPLCLTDEEAARMSHAARQALRRGLVSAINYPLHYVRALHDFRRLLDEGFLGALRRVELKLWFPHWPRAWQPYRKTDWINRREQGGPLREIGSHFVFAVLSLFGGLEAVERVCAQVQYPATDGEVPAGETAETGVLGLMRLRGGVLLGVNLLSDVPSVDEELTLTAYGTRGVIQLADFQNLRVSRDRGPLEPHEGRQVGARQLMSSEFVVAAMAHAIRHDAQRPEAWNLVSIHTGEKIQRILNALRASEGAWIDI